MPAPDLGFAGKAAFGGSRRLPLKRSGKAAFGGSR
jgi:hypothetical protein